MSDLLLLLFPILLAQGINFSLLMPLHGIEEQRFQVVL